MQLVTRVRVGALILACGVLGGTAAITSCRDASTSVVLSNKHAWIGTAHNQSIDDFRAELRRPGVSSNLCDLLAQSVGKAERVPAKYRRGSMDIAMLKGKVLETIPFCSSSRRVDVNARWLPVSAMMPQSADAEQFRVQTDSALYRALDAYDLAGKLNDVVVRSTILPPLEHDGIAVTASVAQSSFEYWPANYPAFEKEVIAEYGYCAQHYASLGYTSQRAFDLCVNGRNASAFGGTEREFSLAMSELAVANCGGTLSAQAWKDFAAADAKGAFTSFFTAAIVSGGTAALQGALLGGAGASIFFAMGKAWTSYWCIMKKRPAPAPSA